MEFSAVLLNEFIEKIIVHEREKKNGIRTQQIDIYLNFIGKFDIPLTQEELDELEKPQERKSRKKLRREMTEEQRERERQRDKERYAKKVAEKKAKEKAVRAEILKGTAYEKVG